MQYDSDGRFKIENYPAHKPFSSFLPGIAGVLGIPMWVFYTNRGQAIAGFGVESKDSPIMEFQPANKAYQLTAYKGFRTFIKTADRYDEPFSPLAYPHNPNRDMFISMNELEIQELDTASGLQTNVVYFTLSNEPFAGLVRQLTLTNTSENIISLELLDGMPAVVPYGVDNGVMKMMARTGEAWLEVFNLDNKVPFFRTRASIVDKSEVEGVEAGNFYLAFAEQAGQTNLLTPIVDPAIIFGSNTALTYPDQFIATDLATLATQKQVTVGKTPCNFVGATIALEPRQSFTLYSIIGHINTIDILNRQIPHLASIEYLQSQRQAAQVLVAELTDTIAIKTSNPTFDAYARQTFLDNVMRGGWPLVLRDGIVYHVYSRKHGDMERDYNAFFLAAEQYSQGNGNYRDVNQNRREDVWLNPAVGDFNICTFINLIQADGYNPLVLTGSKFSIAAEHQASICQLAVQPSQMASFSFDSFALGALLKFIDANDITLTVSLDEFIANVCQHADQSIDTVYGEGYWIDHWTYNLDLIENYLAIYPEQEIDLLFNRPSFTFYDSEAIVRPRHEKYILASGSPRQYNAIKHDKEKIDLIDSRTTHAHVVRTAHGQGDIYHTTLIAKLLSLAIVKMATLDPDGMGVEMEADKPGWYDAINGLPGLFGSSMPETFELLRLVSFIRKVSTKYPNMTIALPIELYALLDVICQGGDYWEVTTAREIYRDRVRLGFDGQEKQLLHDELIACLDHFIGKLNMGIERAMDINNGLPPTYFRYHPTSFDELDTTDDQGRPHIRVNAFEVEVLPLFLEGAVRYIKTAPDAQAAKQVYDGIRNSELFDAKLKMYRLNASLDDQPMDIGRARAFTSGWLENGSIWMHMAYKYLLALLRAGLYTEFYEEFKNGLIPFQNPNVYGRSTLENSSFIASSAHPDESLHGQGFVARLSGSTVELLSMLHYMMAGETPFYVEGGKLHLVFKPVLFADMFDDEDKLQFTFLGRCTVTYHNPQKVDLIDAEPRQIVLHLEDEAIEINEGVISEPHALQVRDGQITSINVLF